MTASSKKKKILNTGTLLTLQQPAYVCGLSKGRARMHACRPTTGHVHLCNFSKNENQQSSKGREYWYGRPTSLKDTEAYRNSKTVSKLIQKHPKEISPKTLEASPVWSPILL
jgi:hypothetical protein